MGQHVIRMPDVGEGVAEAEIVEWMVDIGANIREDEVLASVMTDKATVEIPSPIEGKVIWQGAGVGDILAVGAPLIRLEVDGAGNYNPDDTPNDERIEDKPDATEKPTPSKPKNESSIAAPSTPQARPINGYQRNQGAPRAEGERPLASPAVRKRAGDAGIDLRQVAGSGPAGRITHDDLDAYFDGAGAPLAQVGGGLRRNLEVSETPVIGLRRKIAEQMSIAKSRIPHITYVEEVDVSALEELRAELNGARKEGRVKLTIIPFLMRAMVRAIEESPQMNARFDDEAGIVHRHGGVHIGLAAQTPNGLMVPVVKHAEARDIWDCAGEAAHVAEAAKSGKASRDALSGSTITITSLGAMGGIVTTPVINHPEVAIIGVNKMQILPRWDGQAFQPRKVMNLSSSFDHRVIDGWDAAVFIQKIKSLLENPAMIFVDQ